MADINYEKQFRIKSGALKRTHKEYLSYVQETADQQAKVDQLKTDNADEYKLKKENELLEEVKQMIPNSQQRLQDIYDDFKGWLDEHGQEESIQEQVAGIQETVTSIGQLLSTLVQPSSE